ncbi:hypothetical protein [Haliscomenobacter hydrossis]|uniref:Lipoprotein n=1 Tax=Haliscomenobacter hydrossis (strain ATCC 27775 / DSM 1100 / LMG 10767 / O) TaxID=760192 RepID=F4KT34_HALH1|nr:hypothetical protein [Haliscomenobacter hydrossis]AEE50104.1 hypothetical protein Halhy_2222 [Haliscomenobacter hydrossis DSM 1100]
MLKSICTIALLYTLLLSGIFSCEFGSKKPDIDAETEKLQREVDSLRQVKEALQDELHTVKGDEESGVETPRTPSNTADSEGIPLKVVSAKKQFDANFNPILRITLRNTAPKSVVSANLAIDFSFNSSEISPNCHFEKTLPLKMPAETTYTVNMPIPAGYDKTCADKAWVVVKSVVYSDGTKE